MYEVSAEVRPASRGRVEFVIGEESITLSKSEVSLLVATLRAQQDMSERLDWQRREEELGWS